MKTHKLLLIVIAMIASCTITAQVAINTDGTNPDSSAILDVKSKNMGLLPPRMTSAERDSISSPADGLVIFNTTSNCLNFYAAGYWNETCGTADAPTVYNPATGETWMDRNLGASQVATSYYDTLAHGDLYQWGRLKDGHESRNSGIYFFTSSTDVPGHTFFIQVPYSPYDWRSPKNDFLWQGVNGINNPCPCGFRLPTEAELEAERLSWAANNAIGAFGSPLKLTVGGSRNTNNGSLGNVNNMGYYWSSSLDGTNARVLFFSYFMGTAYMSSSSRASGISIRCIKD